MNASFLGSLFYVVSGGETNSGEYVDPDGTTEVVRGTIEGIIGHEIIGENGFGYDPIFVPEGYDLSFAELGNDIKNTISHRARAVEKLCQFLKK